MDNNQMAKDLFFEYKRTADHKLDSYNQLRTAFPLNRFPQHAKALWRLAVLAEAWGSIATILGGNKVRYLTDWRKGI